VAGCGWCVAVFEGRGRVSLHGRVVWCHLAMVLCG
jgi:hypothetical protein